MNDTTPTMLYFVRKYLFLVLVFVLLGLSTNVHAATGTIDSTEKYAWSNVGGWVNFAATMSTVTVSDTELTGYAWSANNGWINLSPTDGGVLNDGNGTLSGDAWDGSSGWISFDGVTIDANGYFTGQATGENGYVLNFDCGNCSVRTDWRAVSEVTSGSSGTSGSRSRADTSTSTTQEPVPVSSPVPATEEPTFVPVRSPNYPPEGDVIQAPPTQSTNATETPSTTTPIPPEVENEILTITPQPASESVIPVLDIKFLIPFSFFLLLLIIGIILYARQHRS